MSISSNIKKLWEIFFSTISSKILVVITLVFFIGSLWHNLIYADDSWFGEQAYWFAKCGFPKTETMKDFLGFDKHLFVYHKLNIFLGAIIIRFFGFSVYYLKSLTLLLYAIFFLVYYNFFKQNSNYPDKKTFLIASVFIFVNPIMISLSFSYRPEIMVMLFGFLSYVQLDKYLRFFQNKFAIYSGISAGLAFLSHPNGLIFSLAGLIILLINRQFKAAILFGCFSTLIASLFFYDLIQPGHFATYLYQLHNWPDNVGSNYNDFGLKNILLKLTEEHKRFFWSFRVMAFSGLFLLCLVLFFRKIFRENKLLVQYLLLLIVSLNIFGSQIAERYLIYFFPYFGIVIAVSIHGLTNEKKYLFKTAFMIVFVFQIFFTGKIFAEIYSKNDYYISIHHQVLNHIADKNALTLVPNEYVFNEIKTRNLVVYKVFEYYQKANGNFTQETFFARAKQLQIKYIVIGKRILTNDDAAFPFFTNKPISENPYYDVFCREKDFIILKSKE